MPSDRTVQARLDALERTHRRLQRIVALFALGLAGLLAASFVAPADEEVRSSRFILTDAEGEEVGAFALDAKGFPNLTMKKDRASAALTLNGPGFLLRGGDGKKGAWMGMDSQGAVGLSLNGEKFLDGIRLLVKPDGAAGAYLLDEHGEERIALEHLTDGTASLNARDDQGITRAFLGLTGADLPALMLLDSQGTKRAGILVQSGGEPLISLDDARGRSRVELTQGFDGSPRMRMLDKDGAIQFEAP